MNFRQETTPISHSLPKGWKSFKTAKAQVFYAGTRTAAEIVADTLDKVPTDPSTIATKLAEVPDHYAVIVSNGETTLAAVDHVRSIPIFWKEINKEGSVAVSPDAHTLPYGPLPAAFDPTALLEFAMAGYVSGSKTLIPDIAQLQAGEIRQWKQTRSEDKSALSYKHWPQKWDSISTATSHKRLSKCLNDAFNRTMTKANGKLILVPLSGGLDSRLVLAKLVEKGYGPLEAFSYGPQQNADAETARKVADHLGVPWTYVVTTGQRARALLGSKLLEDYWKFSDGLCTVPNHQDLLPLTTLLEDGKVPGDVVVVNGQTGDFISGGHIPATFAHAEVVRTSTLLETIITKHYGLWRNLMTTKNVSIIESRIRRQLELDPSLVDLTGAEAAALFELWEYRERQAKYIVNGQRVYDFLGLRWDLPLWDRDFITFWRDMTLNAKFNQTLYRDWLQSWDYRGVFTDISTHVTAWPTFVSNALLPFALALRLTIGRSNRDLLFRYLNYFDRFSDHYKVFGFRTFAKHAQMLRNPASLYTKAWLEHQGIQLNSLAS